MPAMPQDGRVIVAIFLAFSFLIGTNSATTNNEKCKYCQKYIQSILNKNDMLRIFEEKSWLTKSFIQNIVRENSPVKSGLSFVKFCMDACLDSGETIDGSENNSIRSKRNINEGVYQYFSPPFSHITNDNSEYEVEEEIEDPVDTANFYETSRAAYQGRVKGRKQSTTISCECVREQEESLKRMIAMVENFAERILDYFRGIVRDEVNNQLQLVRPRESWSLGVQQNYFIMPVVAPATIDPVTEQPKVEELRRNATIEVTEEPATFTVSTTEADITTTELMQGGAEITEEVTTETTTDLGEIKIMRTSENIPPNDCDKKHDIPTYLPALLQAFKPTNE